MFGTTELLIVFAIIIIFFGARKLPQLARAVGDSVRAFRSERDR